VQRGSPQITPFKAHLHQPEPPTPFSMRRIFPSSGSAVERRWSGREAGPRFTFPSMSNSLPWQGHSNSCRSAFQLNRHPRCVQRSSRQDNAASPRRLTSHAPASGTWKGSSSSIRPRTSCENSRRCCLPDVKKRNLPVPRVSADATAPPRTNKAVLRKERLAGEGGSDKFAGLESNQDWDMVRFPRWTRNPDAHSNLLSQREGNHRQDAGATGRPPSEGKPRKLEVLGEGSGEKPFFKEVPPRLLHGKRLRLSSLLRAA